MENEREERGREKEREKSFLFFVIFSGFEIRVFSFKRERESKKVKKRGREIDSFFFLRMLS